MSVWIIILQWYINRLLRSTMMIESFFIFCKKNISFDVSFYFLSCVIVHVNILLVISYLSDVLAKVWHWAKTNYQAHWYSQIQLPVIRQKGQSQNGCFKKTKHVKFSEKRTFLTPWYTHILLPYYWQIINFVCLAKFKPIYPAFLF